MCSYCSFLRYGPTDQITFPQQHWNVATFHEKNPNFCIKPIHSSVLCEKLYNTNQTLGSPLNPRLARIVESENESTLKVN